MLSQKQHRRKQSTSLNSSKVNQVFLSSVIVISKLYNNKLPITEKWLRNLSASYNFTFHRIICTANRIYCSLPVDGSLRNEKCLSKILCQPEEKIEPSTRRQVYYQLEPLQIIIYLHLRSTRKSQSATELSLIRKNTILNSYLKHLTSTSKIYGTVHTNPLPLWKTLCES